MWVRHLAEILGPRKSLRDDAMTVPKVGSLVAQMVKSLPAKWDTRVRSLGWEDPLEKGMATHSRILAWRIPWTEKPGGYSPWGRKESDSRTRLSD